MNGAISYLPGAWGLALEIDIEAVAKRRSDLPLITEEFGELPGPFDERSDAVRTL